MSVSCDRDGVSPPASVVACSTGTREFRSAARRPARRAWAALFARGALVGVGALGLVCGVPVASIDAGQCAPPKIAGSWKDLSTNWDVDITTTPKVTATYVVPKGGKVHACPHKDIKGKDVPLPEDFTDGTLALLHNWHIVGRLHVCKYDLTDGHNYGTGKVNLDLTISDDGKTLDGYFEDPEKNGHHTNLHFTRIGKAVPIDYTDCDRATLPGDPTPTPTTAPIDPFLRDLYNSEKAKNPNRH